MAKNSESVQVKIYKLANRLRRKLGQESKNTEGQIDEAAIAEADKLIEVLCAQCPATIAGHLESINIHWAKMRDMPESPEREHHGLRGLRERLDALGGRLQVGPGLAGRGLGLTGWLPLAADNAPMNESRQPGSGETRS